MYFTLTVNEQLASAMRAAAEFKAEKIIKSDCIDTPSNYNDLLTTLYSQK